jgi:ribonuclease HII
MRSVVCGVDEVGRGCLAGPVVAAAVALPDAYFPGLLAEKWGWIEEIRDSKKLSPKKRERLSALIWEHCHCALGKQSVEEIDRHNILQATLRAMSDAVKKLYRVAAPGRSIYAPPQLYYRPLVVLVDGNRAIPEKWLRETIDPRIEIDQHTVKGGDDIHKAIGAASIIAKVSRDWEMEKLDAQYPGYGFAKHRGYGTEQHRQAIMELGVTPIHRRTFRGVHEYVQG